MSKICHITSVHPAEDIRIFQKECVSLAKAGHQVYLVQQGESYDKDGVHLIGFGEIAQSRIQRMLHTSKNAVEKALEVDADIYHLHDPELLSYAKMLKKRGKKVIFDSHEDVPADILEKYWIPAPLRKLISRVYARYEAHIFPKLDGVIGVTPTQEARLAPISRRYAMVTNYPIWVEDMAVPAFAQRKIAFTGMISESWAIENALKAIEDMDGAVLELRSRTIEEPYGSQLRSEKGWEKVNFPGRVPHAEVLKLLSECMCGIALLRESPNTDGKVGTLGNTKIFEYMMAGIPIVCTDFILWKEIVDQWDCGICVDPDNVEQIRQALQFILEHPEEARKMGENGRRAIRESYNWEQQEKVLFAFYDSIL